jgi:hypothetical protein
MSPESFSAETGQQRRQQIDSTGDVQWQESDALTAAATLWKRCSRTMMAELAGPVQSFARQAA